jgi:hypothetical protein
MLGLGKFPNTYRDDLIDMAMDLGRHEEFTWYRYDLVRTFNLHYADTSFVYINSDIVIY